MKKSIAIIVMLIIAASFSGKACAQNPEPSEKQEPKDNTHFKFSVRPMIAFADFGNNDFRNQIKTITGESMHNFQWGGCFQIGMYSDKKWGIGLEYNLSGNNSPYASTKPTYKYLNMYGGFYGEYDFMKIKRFVLSGQLALGFGRGHFEYNSDLSSDKIDLEDFVNLPLSKSFVLNQRLLGYASLGIQAEWVVIEGLRLGAYVKWVQQIGKGNWYTANRKTLIDDLAKSSFTPLQMGISLALTF